MNYLSLVYERNRRIELLSDYINSDRQTVFIKQKSQEELDKLTEEIEAIKAYRYLLEKYGSDWKDKI